MGTASATRHSLACRRGSEDAVISTERPFWCSVYSAQNGNLAQTCCLKHIELEMNRKF